MLTLLIHEQLKSYCIMLSNDNALFKWGISRGSLPVIFDRLGCHVFSVDKNFNFFIEKL